MDIRQIKYALALAHYRSFTKAALALSITQPALSAQIRLMEEELGTKLFVRSTRSVALTDAGREFCEKAAELVKLWDELMETRGRHTPEQTPIKIGVTFIAQGSQLLSLCTSFFERRPEYVVSYMDASDETLVNLVLSGKIDAALCKLPLAQSAPPNSRALKETLILTAPNYVIVSKSHPFSGRKELSLLELQSSRIITSSGKNSDYQLLTSFAGANGLAPFSIIQTNDTSLAIQLVKSGEVVMLGPKTIADYYEAAAVPMLERVNSSVGFVYSPRSANPVLEELETYLINAFGG